MNPGLVVKLRPSGPWRIGPDSGARNRVDVIYHSDSLYSAITSAMARLGWLEEWLDATARTGASVVSFGSCFPYMDDLGFVVPPRTVWPPASPSAKSARVRWKSARFVPLTVVQSILAGKRLDENQWSVDGPSDCLVPNGRPGPFRTAVRWSAGVDRLTGVTERHSTACIEFRPGAGLWTVVSFADETAHARWADPVKAAFRLLADSGFGGERSRGWGRSEAPEFTDGMLPELILPLPKADAKAADPVRAATIRERSQLAAMARERVAAEAAPSEPVPATEVETATEAISSEGAPAEAAPPIEPVVAAEAAPAEPVPATDVETATEATSSEEAPVEAAPTIEPVVAEEVAPAEPVPATEVETATEAMSSEGAPAEAAPLIEPVVAEEAAPAEPVPATEVETATEAMSSEGAPAEAAPLIEPVVAEEAAPAEPVPATEVETATEAMSSEGAPAEAAPLIEPVVAEEAAPAEPVPATETATEATSSEEAPVEAAPMIEPVVAEEAAPAEPVPATEVETATEAAVAPPPEPEPEPPVVEAGAPTHPHWLLSVFTPATADTVDWRRGNYTVLARGGRVESPAGSGGLKKQIQMVAEGSVIYAETAPRGSAADVAPDGFAHPVFRAGFALAIPLPEVS